MVTAEAGARARAGGGPTLIEAKTFRMGGHSTSDDPSRYVPKALFEEWSKRDPIERFEKFLLAGGLLAPQAKDEVWNAALEEVATAAREAESVPKPGLETIFSDVYAEVPAHLRAQGAAAFDLAARMGDAAAGDGKFPL
jgi:pyruvate dehydrogenase E1 component alpha subunit